MYFEAKESRREALGAEEVATRRERTRLKTFAASTIASLREEVGEEKVERKDPTERRMSWARGLKIAFGEERDESAVDATILAIESVLSKSLCSVAISKTKNKQQKTKKKERKSMWKKVHFDYSKGKTFRHSLFNWNWLTESNVQIQLKLVV